MSARLDLLDPGTPVAITVDAGAMATPTSTRFIGEVVPAGTEATYHGPADGPGLVGWHIATLVDGRYVPLHTSQFTELDR